MPIRAQIRAEQERDHAAVHTLNAAVFETPAEADLVERLRREARPLVSLVAEHEGTVVGHILFTPVELPHHPELRLMALAPMAVAPAHQSRGIGSALVREGLERCRHLGTDAVIVLGHPDYYPRFGFIPASRWGLRSPYDAPDEAFLALELCPGALDGKSGVVEYHRAFEEV
ncbi:MAG: GNAT family N-acetyltransferase [Thermoanaerobaculia bacterium]